MNVPGPTPNSGSEPLRLLLVDDEPELLSTLAEILQDLGYAVVSTWEGEEAVGIASLFQPNVLITDFRLPGIDGVTTIRRVRQNRPTVTAILMSGDLSCANRQRAVVERVDRIFEKPVSVRELLQELKWAAGPGAPPADGPDGAR